MVAVHIAMVSRKLHRPTGEGKPHRGLCGAKLTGVYFQGLWDAHGSTLAVCPSCKDIAVTGQAAAAVGGASYGELVPPATTHPRKPGA